MRSANGRKVTSTGAAGRVRAQARVNARSEADAMSIADRSALQLESQVGELEADMEALKRPSHAPSALTA